MINSVDQGILDRYQEFGNMITLSSVEWYIKNVNILNDLKTTRKGTKEFHYSDIVKKRAKREIWNEIIFLTSRWCETLSEVHPSWIIDKLRNIKDESGEVQKLWNRLEQYRKGQASPLY